MGQWLRLCTVTVGGVGLTSGWETEVPYATGCGKKKIVKILPIQKYQV